MSPVLTYRCTITGRAVQQGDARPFRLRHALPNIKKNLRPKTNPKRTNETCSIGIRSLQSPDETTLQLRSPNEPLQTQVRDRTTSDQANPISPHRNPVSVSKGETMARRTARHRQHKNPRNSAEKSFARPTSAETELRRIKRRAQHRKIRRKKHAKTPRRT